MTTAQMDGLREALRYGGETHTLSDVLDAICHKEAQLWEEEDAVIVTEVHSSPRRKLVHFWLATGDIDAVIALSHRILDWAKGIGCDGATLSGRRGWERVLKAEGWSPALTMMSREV